MTSANILNRVERACAQLRQDGQPVTFTAVAIATGVGRTTLYRNPDLRAVVDQTPTKPPPAAPSPGSPTRSPPCASPSRPSPIGCANTKNNSDASPPTTTESLNRPNSGKQDH